MKFSMKAFAIVAVLAFTGTAAQAQTAPTAETPKAKTKAATKSKKAAAKQVALKDHVCTDACHKSGKCVYVHGEKGHKCDASCAKM
jgi:hypothetical protein